MTLLGERVADEVARPLFEAPVEPQQHPHRFRRALGMAAMALTFGTMGAGIGLYAADHTEAHANIAGTPAQIRVTHDGVNQLSLDHTAIVLRMRAPEQQKVLGEPVDINLNLDVDTGQFFDPKTQNIDTTKLSVQAAAFSDLKQVEHDIEWAVLKHDLEGLALGAGAGLFLYGAYRGMRAWREAQYVRSPETAHILRAHDQRRSVVQRRLALALAIGSVVGIVPSAQAFAHPPAIIHANPALAGTPLEGAELSGTFGSLVPPVITMVRNQITDNEQYYTGATDNMLAFLHDHDVYIPEGKNVHTFMFQTDMHCNTGMAELIDTTAHTLHVPTIVLGGDNAFSGSFPFEAGCTSSMAELAKKYEIKIVAIGGNHDSPMTIAAAAKQGIIMLKDGKVMVVNGVPYAGDDDPRTSRFGEGLRPASNEAQAKLLDAEAQRIGALVCKFDKPAVVVQHDPLAGQFALQEGCGNAFLALDGHTHTEAGPHRLILPNGQKVYQFTGGSAGGAPSEKDNFTEDNPFSHITVGKLNRDARFYAVSVDTETGSLVALTSFTVTPARQISATQVFSAPEYAPQTEPKLAPSGAPLAENTPQPKPSAQPSSR